jgi:hypothetical protein
MSKAFALIPVVFVAVLAGGCSSSSNKKMMMMANTTAFPITVVDANTRSPMPQVALALDDAKGTRVEGTTDATGVVTLMVDWTQAPVTLSAWIQGYTAASYLGVTKSDKYTIGLASQTTPTGTMVTGNIADKDMGTDAVTLSPSVHGTNYQNTTLNYSLTIFDDKPYSLYGLDWVVGTRPSSGRGVAQTFKKWVQVDAPAPSQSGGVDFDFAAGTTLTAIDTKGSLTIPAPMSGPMAKSSGYVTVTDIDSYYSAFLGAPTLIDVTSDLTQFTYSMEHVEPAGITQPLTSYYIIGTGGLQTVKNATSWPTDGESITDLLVPPLVTTPVPGQALPIAQAPDFTPTPGDVSLFLQILANGGKTTQTVLWYVYAPTGTPLLAPTLPSAADPDVVLPPGELSGQVVACGPANSITCTYYAMSDRFNFSR